MSTAESVENTQWMKDRDAGVGFLDERKYEDAVKALEAAIAGDTGGESHALLGLAHFQLGRYDLAATHYQISLDREPEYQLAKVQLAKLRAMFN